VGLRLFKQRYNLLALHTGKALEKILDGVAGLEMLEKTLHRHTRTRENGFAAEYVRI
jgi:hypothetical protein